jgi:predicted flap endonuclease-1-like 5' DNA nuclease
MRPRRHDRLPAPPPVEIATDAGGDDLTRIKGLGPKLKTLLASLGVTRFDQIAGWSEEDVAGSMRNSAPSPAALRATTGWSRPSC